MVDFGGWDMPVSYGPIGPEHLAARTAAGLFDIGHMGQVLVEGGRALDFLQAITTNDVSKLGDGRMQYSLLPNAEGGLHDDIIVTRLGENRYYVVVNASNTDADFAWMRSQAGTFGVEVRLWEGRTLLAVQGPRAQEILEPLAEPGLDKLAYYHLRRDRVAGVEALVSRSGYTGEDGFEISVPESAALEIWSALGKSGIASPVGLGARNTLRLEAAYPLYGHEISAQWNPYDANLGWVIKPEKGDFIGKKAILEGKGASRRRLAGFRLMEKGVARDGYAVLDAAGEKTGWVTSGAPSPSLGNACIGLAYVPTTAAVVGGRIRVEVRGRALEAEIIPTPFVPSHVRKNV
jgi:aminomethyltransferase